MNHAQRELLQRLHDAGVVLAFTGDTIRYRCPRGAMTPRLLQGLQDAKEDLLHEYHERAGILEYDGGLPRSEAEYRALKMLWDENTATFNRDHPAIPLRPPVSNTFSSNSPRRNKFGKTPPLPGWRDGQGNPDQETATFNQDPDQETTNPIRLQPTIPSIPSKETAMSIQLQNKTYPATVWDPAMGTIAQILSYDTETTLIRDPAQIPDYVLASVCDGERVFFIPRRHLKAFWQAHRESGILFHSAAFDLAVTEKACGFDFSAMIEQGRIHDIAILYRLYECARTGLAPQQYNLGLLSLEFLGLELDKDDAVRTDFGRFYHAGQVDEAQIPGTHLEYAARDAIVTWRLGRILVSQCRRIHEHENAGMPYGLLGHHTDLSRQAQDPGHPSPYNLILKTGRTSCSGPNIQNLPREGGIRECLVAGAGHVLVACDYSMLELCTLAQVVYTRHGRSRMRELINDGVDLHRHVAAIVLGKPEEQITKAERQKAKAVNFGLPGGMGVETLQDYARSSFGVDLSRSEAESWKAAWVDLFPEMLDYLDGGDALERLGTTLDVFDFPADCEPNAKMAAGIVMRIAGGHVGSTSGRGYTPEEQHWAWEQIERSRAAVMKTFRDQIRARTGSPDLQRAIQPGYVAWIPTGRLRADCPYASSRNWPFQALAADGAKLALYALMRAGYRTVAFIHDEVLVEVPERDDYRAVCEDISGIMIRAMREVCPDVEIRTESVVMRRWSKDARETWDDEGRLLVWEPALQQAG